VHQFARPEVLYALPAFEYSILDYSFSIDSPVASLRHAEKSVIEQHLIHEDPEAEDVLLLGKVPAFWPSFAAPLVQLKSLRSDVGEGESGGADGGERVMVGLSKV
jgi:hypothetical protein